ncbi:hypothetical protein BDZ90DRAFT_277701 [Jaminaea rosea]|uniref:Pentacotripeptide-repeat region of PRORP domain-containing protein n=1 Tax=Jaminaea rosea TaxID=1569628 RepID=A0A316UZS5_9BASI|nr:hypothetical protein BDZ90DRAFT_277701 [Jaminaea rosea]PWN29423.1 hypothetical protein BDZ90DRAFT_277701 [Jaminaea rosea]
MRETLYELMAIAQPVLERPDLRKYGAVLAQQMVRVSLLLRREGGHRSERNTHIPEAGSLALKLLPFVDSQHGTLKTRTLRAQALALAGNRRLALLTLDSVLAEAGENLVAALGPTQQVDPSNMHLFVDIAAALQAILELDLVWATAAKGLTPGLASQRAEMLRLSRILTPYRGLGEISNGPSSRREDAADLREARAALHRLCDVLTRYNLALPCTSHAFRDLMLAFDDNVALLSHSALREVVEDALARDSYAASRILVALASSLVRMNRLDHALLVVKMAHQRHFALPPQVVETLIRNASGAGSGQIADAVVALVFQSADHEEGHRIARSTWIAMAGYIARKGDQALLKEVWRRIIAEYPDEAGSRLLKDHFLVVYARGEGTMGLMRKHLADHWILPDSEETTETARLKRPFTEHTYKTVIHGFCQGGNLGMAEQYLDFMDQAGLSDASTYNTLLLAYVHRSDVANAKSFWSRYDSRGVTRNAATYEIMARLFAQRGDVESAFSLLDILEQSGTRPSQKILGTMIAALTRAAEYKRATQLFQAMLKSGSAGGGAGPDVVAWNSMLRILVTRAAPFERVMQLLEDMEKEGVEPDDKTFALAMQSASEAGDLASAEHLFARADGAEAKPSDEGTAEQESKKQEDEENDETYGFDAAPQHRTTTTTSSSSQPEQHDPLVSLKQRRANRYHFTILIHALLGAGNVSAAKEYFDEMQRRGLRIDSLSWSVLARAYTKSDSESNQRLARDIVMRRMDEADRASHDESDPGVRLSPAEPRGKSAEILVTPLLVRAANVGDLSQVEGIIGELESDGIELSISTMNILLDAYRRTSEIGSMLAAWERIFKRASANTGLASQLRIERQNVDGDLRAASKESKGRAKIPASRGSSAAGRAQRYGGLGVLSDIEVPQVQRNALCVSLSIVLDALLSAGMHEAIASIWSRARAAGFAFDPSNWNDLAVALCRVKRVPDALRVVERVLNEVRGAQGEEREMLFRLREKRREAEERRRSEQEWKARLQQQEEGKAASTSAGATASAEESLLAAAAPSQASLLSDQAADAPRPSLNASTSHVLKMEQSRPDDQVLSPTSSAQRRKDIVRRERNAAHRSEAEAAAAEEEADEDEEGSEDESSEALEAEEAQKEDSTTAEEKRSTGWRLPIPSATRSPLDVDPDERLRSMSREAAARRGGGVSTATFLQQQRERREHMRRRRGGDIIDPDDEELGRTAGKGGKDKRGAQRKRQHPILEALARQRRYDDSQAVWVAEWRTLDEVREALQRYGDEESKAQAHVDSGGKADLSNKAGHSAAASTSGDADDLIEALLSRFPLARDVLDLQWEKQRAEMAKQREMEARVRFDEAARLT